MIRRKTVLVLGAGASAPYGFPVARELLFDVTDGLAGAEDWKRLMLNDVREMEHKRNLSLRSILGLFQFDPGSIAEFRDALASSPWGSVDTFLENHPKFKRMGKVLMAGHLIQKEDRNRLVRGRDLEWYEFVFGRMFGDEPEQFEENQLSVVTFNYDRSFEYALYYAARKAYESVMSEEVVEGLVKSIPVVHLYGQLGYPHFDSDRPREELRDYDKRLSIQSVERGALGIRLVGERETEDGVFARAQELIAACEELYFLGFGFDQANMDRLNVIRLLTDNQDKNVWCTVDGLPIRRRSELEESVFLEVRSQNRIRFYQGKIIDLLQAKNVLN